MKIGSVYLTRRGELVVVLAAIVAFLFVLGFAGKIEANSELRNDGCSTRSFEDGSSRTTCANGEVRTSSVPW